MPLTSYTERTAFSKNCLTFLVVAIRSLCLEKLAEVLAVDFGDA